MTDKYPSILKLREKEGELEQELALYTALYQQYTELLLTEVKTCGLNKNTGETQTNCLANVGTKDLQTLHVINERIIGIIDEIYDMLTKLYPKGIVNQNDIKIQSVHLAKIAKDLEKDSTKLERLLGNAKTLGGNNYNQELERTSYSYYYAGWSIAALAALFITFKQLAK